MASDVQGRSTIKSGVEKIAAERKRQIEVEGWTEEHDDHHNDDSLVMAAICYAAPEPLYRMLKTAHGFLMTDPWPPAWDRKWQKYTCQGQTRIRRLVKAGALIAAEIDRLQRAKRKERETHGR